MEEQAVTAGWTSSTGDLKETEAHFRRSGGGGSSVCRTDMQHRRLEDTKVHFSRRGGEGKSA